MIFLDKVRIQVTSGRGGRGAVSFRRESRVPFGGPDGGDGGRGGHIIFKTHPQISSLLDFRYKKKYTAPSGNDGKGQFQNGARGKDLLLYFPLGTMVYDLEGRKLHDLDREGEWVFLKGGRGGKGNAFFKSSVNQAPRHTQPGEEGEKKDIELKLKIMADVGIIGLPNAGKSTLISRLSRAKPKVADYPFTTLVPQLGVVPGSEGKKSFVVVDIPGLIEGASRGKGLGIEFLRHIERAKFLIHLVDVSDYESIFVSENISCDKDSEQNEAFSSPVFKNSSGNQIENHQENEKRIWKKYTTIQAELEKYEEKLFSQKTGKRWEEQKLTQKEQIVAFSKIETLSPAQLKSLLSFFRQKGVEVLPLSSVTGENIKTLIFKLEQLVFK